MDSITQFYSLRIFSLGLDISIEMVKSGELVVKGYTAESQDWDRVFSILSQDIPDVVTIDSQKVFTLDEVLTRVNQHMLNKGFSSWVAVDSQSDGVVVSGTLPDEQYVTWEQALADLNQKMGFVIRLDDQVVNAKDQKLDIPIRSISIGDVSYLTLEDNSKYM